MEAVSVCLQSDDQHGVMLKAGTCVLVPFGLHGQPQTLSVARVEAVLKVTSRCANLLRSASAIEDSLRDIGLLQA